MRLHCPVCGSKDLWQPRRKTSFDFTLERYGYERFDCRNCWKRSVFRVNRQKADAGAPPPVYLEKTAYEEKATDPITPLGPPESTVIGANVLISGHVSSGEGMTIRGVLEGTLAMDGYQLIIEPGGNVAAGVSAASIRVCREGSLSGQVRTSSFVVEDGANFNGNIELVGHS